MVGVDAQLVGLGCSAAFVVVGSLLLKIPPVHRMAVSAASSAADAVVEYLRRNPEPDDPLVVQFREAARHERIRADLQRVRRLLVIDETMSATRQQANRLAYAWLVAEERRLAAAGPWIPDLDEPDLLTSPLARSGRWAPRGSSRSRVEVLELGWRR